MERKCSTFNNHRHARAQNIFHTLRHTHATWLLYNGVDIRTVSERLGHAKVTTTLELYAHVLPGRDDLAAETFGEVMGRIDDERG